MVVTLPLIVVNDLRPKLRVAAKMLGYMFWHFMFIYITLLAVFFRLSVGFLILLTVYSYQFAQFSRVVLKYLDENDIFKKIEECNNIFKHSSLVNLFRFQYIPYLAYVT